MGARSGNLRSDSVLRKTGIIGMTGGIMMVVCTVAVIIVIDQKSWISNTISDFAAGPHEWIQDIGLYMIALALVAVGVGLWRLNLGGWRWTLAAGLLPLLGADIAVMAAWEDYRIPDPGFTLHSYAVYFLGGGFAVVPWLLSRGFERIDHGWARANTLTSVTWIVLAPIYFLVPQMIEGLYERGLGVIMVGWVLTVSWLLYRSGRPA